MKLTRTRCTGPAPERRNCTRSAAPTHAGDSCEPGSQRVHVRPTAVRSCTWPEPRQRSPTI
jgi:hypothetical protein